MTLVATVPEPGTVSWINDTQLALSGRRTRRDAAARADSRILGVEDHLHRHRAGARARRPDTWVLPIPAGPRRGTAPEGGGVGGRGGNAVDRRDAFPDRSPDPDFKRRSIVGRPTGGEPRLVHEDVKEKFWSMTGDAAAGRRRPPTGSGFLRQRSRRLGSPLRRADRRRPPKQITKGYQAWRPSWSPTARDRVRLERGPNPGNAPHPASRPSTAIRRAVGVAP